jgi:hypothetical protein
MNSDGTPGPDLMIVKSENDRLWAMFEKALAGVAACTGGRDVVLERLEVLEARVPIG